MYFTYLYLNEEIAILTNYAPNQIVLCLRIFNPSFDQQYSYLVFGPLKGPTPEPDLKLQQCLL